MVKFNLKNHLPFLLILLLAIFLRFYRINDNLVFHGELGDNYLHIYRMFSGEYSFLLGPATSHPWLYFGPLYYYLMAPVLFIFGGSPLSGAYLFAIIGVITIWINYMFVLKHYSLKVALISSFIIAISPAWINVAREARFYSLILPLIYLFLWFLVKSFNGNVRSYGIWGFIFGLILNFHLSPIVLIPAVALLFIIGILRFDKINHAFAGFIVPIMPLIIYEIGSGYEMTRKFFMWIPYRLLGFMGIIPNNNQNISSFLSNIKAFSEFIGKQIVPEGQLVFMVISVLLVSFILFSKKSGITTLFSLFFVIGLLGIFIHGNPPAHYFLPLYPFIVIFLSLMLDWAIGFKNGMIVLLLIFLANTRFFFSEKWFFLPQDRMLNNVVPYVMQVQAVDEIIKDSGDLDITVIRQGPYDYFDQYYSQNYQYLFFLKEKNLVSDSKYIYTIVENPNGGINILKEVK